MYAIHPGAWAGGRYPWTYNGLSQPNTGALSAIQNGFRFITADSSDCGAAATDAVA